MTPAWRPPCGPIIALVLASACAEAPEPPACLAPLPDDCTPLYPAEFTEVYETTLRPGCGVGGTSCHGGEGARGGLVLDDVDEAYALLLDPPDAPARVTPGDPECSVLMRRIEATDPAVTMPPGRRLGDSERCAIAAWIRAGAPR